MLDLYSKLLVASLDEAFATCAEAMLALRGWQCLRTAGTAAALERLAESQPAAILLDRRAQDASAILAAARRLPAPLNGTPILTAGGEDRSPAGPGGHLDLPLAEAPFLRLLRRWVGPLDDHALRRTPWNFRYRLIRLIGLDAADATLLRLKAALEQAVETPSPSGEEALSPHRLAGIAGLCGFAELGRLWAGVERHEEDALAAAIEASRAAIAQLDRALPAAGSGR